MGKSKSNRALEYAFGVGFSVTDEGAIISPHGRTLKTRPDRYGYIQVTLPYGSNKDERIRLQAHRFVAYCKFGSVLFNEDNVRHKDGNPQNNRPDNIDIGSISENNRDKDPEVRLRAARIAARQCRALTDAGALSLKEDRAAGYTYKKLCAKYGIAKSTVSYIVNGKTYKIKHRRVNRTGVPEPA